MNLLAEAMNIANRSYHGNPIAYAVLFDCHGYDKLSTR